MGAAGVTVDDASSDHDEPGQARSTASAHRGASATTVRVGTCQDGVFVEDDGPGIGPEQRAHIFEYGMSTGNSSGFGLAIVRTIVEAHGWEITVTDSRTDGARFEIAIEAPRDQP